MIGPAPIRPSALADIVACRASLQMSAPFPQDDSPEAIEGRAAHWVAHRYQTGHTHEVGQRTECGREVTKAMIDGALLWRATVPAMAVAEVPVKVSRIHPTDCWGTPDAWYWDPDSLSLDVWDYKFGLAYVDEVENPQLVAYAAGILEWLGLNGMDEVHATIRLTIVQPRVTWAEPVRTWTAAGGALRASVNRLFNVAHEALAPNPTATVGQQCMLCPARHVCGTLARAVAQATAYSSTMERADLTAQQAGTELVLVKEVIKRLEAREAGLVAQVSEALRNGQQVTDWQMKARKSPLAWTADRATILAAAEHEGKNVLASSEPPLLTPTQAVAAGFDAEAMGLAIRPPSTVHLSRISHKDAVKAGFGGKSE